MSTRWIENWYNVNGFSCRKCTTFVPGRWDCERVRSNTWGKLLKSPLNFQGYLDYKHTPLSLSVCCTIHSLHAFTSPCYKYEHVFPSIPARVGVIHEYIHTFWQEVIELVVLVLSIPFLAVKQFKQVAAGTRKYGAMGGDVTGTNLCAEWYNCTWADCLVSLGRLYGDRGGMSHKPIGVQNHQIIFTCRFMYM